MCGRLMDAPGDETLRRVATWKLEGYANVEIAARIGGHEYPRLKQGHPRKGHPPSVGMWSWPSSTRAAGLDIDRIEKAPGMPADLRGGREIKPGGAERSFEHPYHWAAFVLVEDPN